MPITIKEIISSDSMSGVIEKINFNFDQLILAGGGPPGIQGIQGIDGPIGPQGFRGDHWFTGPSAFGQTADHDGTALRIKDHFLDETGEVYEYYNIVGVTGWTASGINLKGPTGPEGAAGGSLEWRIYGGTVGNIVSSPTASYGPIGIPAYEPDPLNVNFLIPNSTFKNSVFIGDQNWAYTNLRHFGSSNTGANTDAVPKFTVIQNNVNTLGLNGFSFGGPLIENGASGASATYGNSGATSLGGPTYSAFNFVNAAFMTEQETDGVGDYITKWRLHSFRSNIKIKSGGPTTPGQPQYGWRPAMFEIESDRIRLYDYSKIKYIGIETDGLLNFGNFVSDDTLREIRLNSPNDIYRLRNNSGYSVPPPANTYGYVALQSSEGSGSLIVSGYPEHRLGSVIIGPTYNSAQSIPLATDSYQGLAIVRKITKAGDDAAIRFFQPTIQSGDANIMLLNSRILSQSGSITPIRTTESINGISGIVLDSLVISASNPNAGFSNLILSTGVTAYNGGRLGFSNNPRAGLKPQFPIHIYANPDSTTRNTMWDTDVAIFRDRISNWYAGFDARDGFSNRNGGIAFGNTTWKDDFTIWGGRSSFTPTSVPRTYTNPILKTYTRRDSLSALPYFNSIENAIDIDEIPIWNRTLGIENPHMYMQPGIETFTGNIGIGFVPGTTGKNVVGSIRLEDISYAKSKLAVNGSITIGSANSGYHKFNNNIPSNGLLIGGLVVQGETITQGLNTMRWYGPSLETSSRTFSYFPDDPDVRLQIGFATEKTIMAKQFLSKGSANPMYPDFALPDAKTGMGRIAGEIGVGALFADRLRPLDTSISVSNTVTPVMVAKWSANGDSSNDSPRLGSTNIGVGGFTINETFALSPAYHTLDTLPWYGVAVVATEEGQAPTYANSHRIIYYEIPARKSTVFLDLSAPKSSIYIWGNGFADQWNSGVTPTYLDGFIPSAGSMPIIPRENSNQFTIEDGYYDGQILRIMVLDVHPRNYSVLVPNAIERYESYGPSSPGASRPTLSQVGRLIRKDNIVMAAEKYSETPTPSSGWPLSSPLPTNNNFSIQDPWPIPANSRFDASFGIITPGMSSTIGAAQIDTAIRKGIADYNALNNRYWTSRSLGDYEPDNPGVNGSHGVILDTLDSTNDKPGIGAFRITPWRSITLQWMSDNFQGYGRGCWYEIARENLVSRKARAYSGSGNLDIAGDDEIGLIVPASTIQRTNGNSTSYKVEYSFYNPTGNGSMTISHNAGSPKIVNLTESGFIDGSVSTISSFGSNIYVPGLIGLDNLIEARWKFTLTDNRTNVSTIAYSNSVTSNGPALTFTLPSNISIQSWQTLSIEASVIVRKNISES
jgi:hypothetical protein